MSSSPTLALNVDNTLGPLLIGGLVAAAFWGVTSIQTYIYYQRFPEDSRAKKLLVALLWVLDTLDGCITSHVLYYYLVKNYLNPLALVKPVWTIIIHMAVTTITNVIIRSMFAWKIWQLSGGNVILALIIGIANLCDLVLGLIITAKAFHIEGFQNLDTINKLFYANFGAGIFADFFTAIVLCYYLFNSKTGFQRTDSLLDTLIRYIVASGLLMSIDAILGAVIYIAVPKTLIFFAFYFSLAKMYTNAYLALLNAREHIRTQINDTVAFSLSRFPAGQAFSAESGQEGFLLSNASKGPNRDLEMQIETTADHEPGRKFQRY